MSSAERYFRVLFSLVVNGNPVVALMMPSPRDFFNCGMTCEELAFGRVQSLNFLTP